MTPTRKDLDGLRSSSLLDETEQPLKCLGDYRKAIPKGEISTVVSFLSVFGSPKQNTDSLIKFVLRQVVCLHSVMALNSGYQTLAISVMIDNFGPLFMARMIACLCLRHFSFAVFVERRIYRRPKPIGKVDNFLAFCAYNIFHSLIVWFVVFAKLKLGVIFYGTSSLCSQEHPESNRM